MSDPLLHLPPLRPVSRAARTAAEIAGAFALAVATVGGLYALFGGVL